MKISNDQNRIELDDGAVLVAKKSGSMCGGCHFHLADQDECMATNNDEIECSRKEGFVIFIKECE
ncbi:MAG: hypothetical protein ACRDCY_22605 [Aeromonas veronii]